MPACGACRGSTNRYSLSAIRFSLSRGVVELHRVAADERPEALDQLTRRPHLPLLAELQDRRGVARRVTHGDVALAALARFQRVLERGDELACVAVAVLAGRPAQHEVARVLLAGLVDVHDPLSLQ